MLSLDKIRRFTPGPGWRGGAMAFVAVLGLVALDGPAHAAKSENLVFYSSRGAQTVEIQMIGQVSYVPVLSVLNVAARVGGWQDKGNTLTVFIGAGTQLTLRSGDKKVKVDQATLTLSEPIRVVNGEWVAPLSFIGSVLPRLTTQRVEYRAASNHVFVGDVRPNTFAVRLESDPNGARLKIEFSAPVTVATAAQNGRFFVFVGRQPVEPPARAFHFQDPYLSALEFDDQDGIPKLILTPREAGLDFFTSQASDGKTLVADLVKPGTALALHPPPVGPPPPVAMQPKTQPAPPTVPSGVPAQPAITQPAAPATPPEPVLPIVVLDAGHGGADAGGHSRDGILEKNLDAQLADRVRAALVGSGRYRVVLTRIGDTDPGFDERCVTANVSRPVAFLSFHAGNFGASSPRIAVYTYAMPSIVPESSPAAPRAFVPWSEVQQVHLAESQRLAAQLAQAFAKLSDATAQGPTGAPVRVLRNVDAPAVAIEVGSLSPDVDAAPLLSPDLQGEIGAAVVHALDAYEGGRPQP